MPIPISGDAGDLPPVEHIIAQFFQHNQWAWSLKDGTAIPDETDVEAALDEAARVLYNEKPDTELVMGRLHIVRTENGHDVFMMIGSYK